MALLGEVDTFSDDVVTTVFNFYYETIANLNPIAYGYGIRAPYATQAEIAFYFTINKLAIVRADGVPASCILDDESLPGLHSHDFLVLGFNEFVELLDVLVVQFLQIKLSILLVVLRESVLDGLLQFVLDVAAHVAHLHLGFLGYLVTLLHQVAATLLGGLGDT